MKVLPEGQRTIDNRGNKGDEGAEGAGRSKDAMLTRAPSVIAYDGRRGYVSMVSSVCGHMPG